jgi:4-aminobutyrate aminotransferase/(S)-3-amino-2-methylpropionate transaminase
MAAVPRGVLSATPAFAARAENSEIWDIEGRRYIDFASGIGVLATGHRHPRVIAAAHEQLAHFTHTGFQVMGYGPYIELAERLNATAPFRGGAKTLLLSTGAEAVENAVKIARAATGRSGIIAFAGAFHGRSNLTAALTGRVSPYKLAYGPQLGDVFHVPFPMPYRGITVENSLAALEMLFQVQTDPSKVAAIIIEPVQGEGGIHIAPPALLRALRTLCRDHGILLIADEIQSGFGRTGRLYAIEHSEVCPDIVTVAKSLAGGLPLAAVIGRAALMDFLEPGSLGGTFGGSPVACVTALAVLDALLEEDLLARAAVIGARLTERLDRMKDALRPCPIANVRGLGAMVGFDVLDPDTGKPDGRAARDVATRALQGGLIVLVCGYRGETLRILVPLTISDEVLDEGLSVLEHALR